MSASDKLKTLYEHGATFMVPVPGYIPHNALPHVIALAEAAEVVTRDLIYVGIQGPYNTPLHRLGHALAALDEALSPRAITADSDFGKIVYEDAEGKPFDPQPIREDLP